LPYYFCRMNLTALAGLRDALARDGGELWERVSRG
jgi:hypothetical protein